MPDTGSDEYELVITRAAPQPAPELAADPDHEPGLSECGCRNCDPNRYGAAPELADAQSAAADALIRDVLESLCRQGGLSLESTVTPGQPARNYELAERLGIGHVFGLKTQAEIPAPAAVQPAPELAAVYRERARLVAFLAACYQSEFWTDTSSPGWPVVAVETPTGQMSWHIAGRDMDLFEHVTLRSDEDRYDGHTTEEKYRRLAVLTEVLGRAGAQASPELAAAVRETRLMRELVDEATSAALARARQFLPAPLIAQLGSIRKRAGLPS
jgi:hypothetical protein